ncbi:hypothetical protein EOE67_13660 [Rheinheimera riviphila]|uniref:ATPase dynein-related AAA domain-containing protein n=1 Tax=Rheinheimera riviphila TaxID=1834037 RepID=A0A437QLT4_9GAMM|nr:AAA family ATPase [Rheinheimera riviphila]RVU35419.1 hypothetical protein EOE67_13660 [Rheinheimera riviphila]
MSFSRDGFRDYLGSLKKADGKPHFTNNTIDSYCSGLNHIYNALQIDVWSLTDQNKIQQIIHDTAPTGIHAVVGLHNSRVPYNAIKRWADYVAIGSIDVEPATYLVHWAPARTLNADSNPVTLAPDSELSISCDSKQPAIGDLVYLMRYESSPQGIVAKAVVTRTSFDAPYWSDPTKTWRYIDIKVVEVRQTVAEGLLPELLLERFCDRHQSSFKKSLTKSGVLIPVAIANEVTRLWANSQHVHSLRQFIEWTQQDEVNSRPDWLPQFQERLAEVEQVKTSPEPIPNKMLEWLWTPGYNGICSVMPGVLPRVDFELQKAFLRGVAESIRTEPSAETHQRIFKTWETAVRQGKFEKTYHVVINRVFAAFAAEQYSTIVSPTNCKKVLQCLQQEFRMDLQLPNEWPEQNAWILSSLQDAGVDMSKVAENNVAIWQICKALDARKKIILNETDIAEDVEGDIQVSNTDLVPLNQIYYGPPGTGKTYITMQAAVQAAEPGFSWQTRNELKTEYQRLTDTGRIVFVTFHQSYSYEDFVEGLTAEALDGKVSYKKKSGLFKELVEDAKNSSECGNEAFDRAWQKMLDMLDASGDETIMETIRGKKFKVAFEGNKTFRVYPQNSQQEDPYYVASVSNVRKLYYGATKKGMYNPSYVEGMLSFLKQHCDLPEKPPTEYAKKQNFVLVIDEINRGNISRIFGELITLIEPSRRLGGNEPLEVILPLTGDKFSVPDNLYIIGTMNTADRSLSGLDLALRRRFDFIEMPPQPQLLADVFVEDVDLELMLKTINERIAVLLDKDHCIGHASFMHLHPEHRPANAPEFASLKELAQVFQHKVLPLLQEYFFEDWQRITWVLNDQNKATEIAFIRKSAGKPIAELFKNVSQIKARDRWEINQDAFESAKAYQLIYQDEAASA